MTAQLECRIVLTYRRDGQVDLGMYDPASGRYEPLGSHGPAQDAVDRVVLGLAQSILRAGHRLTWCEQSG